MKKLFIILTLIPIFFTSCNKDEVGMNDETVEVSFTSDLTEEAMTRAASDLTVNQIVCAVFDGNNEIPALRQTKEITDPSAINISLHLVKGRTYNVVFWAMKDANYDVTDMKAIKRSATGSINETDYDAFTATTSITVQDAVTLPLTLTRPLAQVNFGVTELDWNTALQFSQTPTTATITYQASDTFNALTGETVLGSTEIIRRSSCTGSAMSVESVTYKHLGTFYVLMSETERKTLVDVTCNVLDQNATSIRSISIPSVPVQRNYKTNIVGGLLAGTVSYQITLKDFADEEINEEINEDI